MSKILLETSHRPWPLPEGPWTWRQAWNNSLFVHYRAHTNELRSLIPPELEIQEFDGTSWIGVVAFHMNDVMKRPFPNVPWFSNFLELNVRLYVTHKGKPGVWFLSLDATNPLVVWGGRQFYNIPYRNADISYSDSSGVVRFTSQSHDDYERFDVRYCGSDTRASGALENFLTERYCFYSSSRGSLFRTDVHHKPWPLFQASGEILENSLLDGKMSGQPIFHYSPGVDVLSWASVVL